MVEVALFVLHACACESLGLDIKFVVASDRKDTSYDFVQAHHKYQHWVNVADDHAQCFGECRCHGQVCTLPNSDLVVAGWPCQPFSRLRHKVKGGVGKSGSAEDHPDFDVVFQLFPAYLRRTRPSGFIAEETEAFLNKIPDEEGRWVDKMLAACSASGYTCAALVLDSGLWIDWPRKRLSVCTPCAILHQYHIEIRWVLEVLKLVPLLTPSGILVLIISVGHDEILKPCLKIMSSPLRHRRQ
jgi:hypothetical protein